MRNRAFFTGIFGLALVFGIALLVGCKQDDPAPTQYTVSFSNGDSGAGTAPESKKVEEGKSTTLPAGPSAPTGKKFAGWTANGVTYQPGSSYTVNSDTVFTAQWETTTPAAPTGIKVTVRNFTDDSISRIVIYKRDDTQPNSLGQIYQQANITLPKNGVWDEGRITDQLQFIVVVEIGGVYGTSVPLDVYANTKDTIINYTTQGLAIQLQN
jgi:hypothetical protein